ncbi:MAG: PepSY domain-containing protein [Hyphomicrobiaceae bacterium]|nr:peptidase [Hyphomicrobiaceae bacterium]
MNKQHPQTSWGTTTRHLTVTIAVATACLLASLAPSFADDDKSRQRRKPNGAAQSQQDQIRDALKLGEIRPLAEIMVAAEAAVPGQVVGVEVERIQGKLVYELKIVSEKGRIREVYVDAANLDIIKVK